MPPLKSESDPDTIRAAFLLTLGSKFLLKWFAF
jgi:hypothetical protein